MEYYLDNILLQDEPDGEIVTTIKRDSELGGYLITNDAKLNFHGDGYAYIQSRLEATGYCGEIDVKIKDKCNGEQIQIFVGKIFLLQIEKNSNCIINTPLQDNNYYARISKNKSIKTFIDSTRSKNGSLISAAKVNHMTMFNPATGANLAVTRQGWRVYDVFTNLTAFLSDDEMTFDSTLLGLGGEFEGLSITTGQELFFATSGKAPQVSFSEFYSEVNKKLHTVIFIDATGNVPKMFIESDATTYTNNIIKKLEAVGEVTFKVDASKLIAKVNVGSTQTSNAIVGNGVSFVEDNKYFTFKNEEYVTLGQCNIDSTLDLVSQYIISSNIIEDILIATNSNFSDNIIFVDCENVVVSGSDYTSNAIEGSPFTSTPPVFYNRRLMNDQVLARWANAFPNSITSYQGTVNNLFRAMISTTTGYFVTGTVYDPVQFDNDFAFPNFDGNGIVNNYGNGTVQGLPVSAANSRYTCPEDGNYTMFVQLRVQMFNDPIIPESGDITIVVRRFSSGGTLLDQDFSNTPVTAVEPAVQDVFLLSKVFPCDQTDYFTVATIWGSTAPSIIRYVGGIDSYFAAQSAPNSQGIITFSNQQGLVPLIKADMEYPIKNSDFYDIQNNLFDKIAFTFNIKNNPQVQYGWIDILKYNHNTSQANITLRGTQTLIQ